MPSTRTTFLVLAAGSAAFAMLQSLVTPVLPVIQDRLGTSQNAVTWVMTANLLSAAIFTPILGRVGDAAGKDRVLAAVMWILAAGCLVAALAPNIGVLIAGRALQGVAGAVYPLAYGIIRDEYPPERVAAGVGGISAVIAAGGGLGIVLAGPVTGTLGYTWLFWIPMAVSAAGALAVHLFVPASPVRTGARFGPSAALLLAAWPVCLLLAVGRGPERGWGSPVVLGLFLAAAVLLAAWLVAESRAANPLIDLRVFRLPAVRRTNLVALLFGGGQFALFTFLPQFLQTPADAGYGFGATVTEAGLLLLPMLAAMFAAGLLTGRLQKVADAKAQLFAGSVLTVAAFAALAFAHDAPWQAALAAAVFGVGLGTALPAMTNLIVGNVPAEQAGAASGMNANMRTIGGAIGAALVGAVVTARPAVGGHPPESGYASGFLLLAAVAVAAAATTLLIPRARPRAGEPPTEAGRAGARDRTA
ncbi:MFS transporter [Actinomadura sp. CNU-125]|uniref:MFS transporter n=1 Tax=Actinomadura sp. CNU-125 TaxID=1904961 RepID=UPI00095D0F57|nr:MFS transporter [Actinomadura sp. CNU-125]OLT24712.1 MFS transporter [Actinomadura sp. CNU-125]